MGGSPCVKRAMQAISNTGPDYNVMTDFIILFFLKFA